MQPVTQAEKLAAVSCACEPVAKPKVELLRGGSWGSRGSGDDVETDVTTARPVMSTIRRGDADTGVVKRRVKKGTGRCCGVASTGRRVGRNGNSRFIPDQTRSVTTQRADHEQDNDAGASGQAERKRQAGRVQGRCLVERRRSIVQPGTRSRVQIDGDGVPVGGELIDRRG